MAVRTAYTSFVRRARGDAHDPYEYQQRIGEEGLPEVLSVPTGCGKTAAVVLGWLFRRREHPDLAVRRDTPHWLVYTLPQRVLVEQTHELVRQWLANLGLTGQVGCHLAIGGAGRERDQRGTWRNDVDRDAVLVGTQDMLLSRQLNRGYGDSRWLYPVDYGLLNAGCHFVYDETQLMGPAMPTSRQLHGLRQALGVAAPCRSTWMSATLDESTFRTVDCPDIGTRHELSDADRTGPLRARLEAAKTIGRIDVAGKTYARDLAAAVLAEHQPGTRSIVVLNTVDRALEVKRHLAKGAVPVVLVHSRFRPGDRARHIDAALADPGDAGTIVVTTQVLEAGVDVTSHLLVTEAAPWPSVVQRAGRCNRDGKDADAQLRWVAPPNPMPYEQADVDAAVERLSSLEGASATPTELAVVPAAVTPVTHPVLRRRDLLELFDTLPDLSGNDLDVGRFIRDADDRTVEMAWIDLSGAIAPQLRALPAAAERCPAPVVGVRKWLSGGNGRAFRHDHLAGRWVPCLARDVRPGMVLVADMAVGGYVPDDGWSPGAKAPVPPVDADVIDPSEDDVAGDLAVDDDPGSVRRKHWQGLAEHCNEVGVEADRLLGELDPAGITPARRQAAVLAARLHDIGKAHEVFQNSMRKLLEDGDRSEADACGPLWAKSASDRPLRHERHYFRHELASALMLLGEGRVVLDAVDHPDLVRYLVAAHHGRARLGVRSLQPTTTPVSGAPVEVLGVRQGDRVDAVDLGDLVVPASTLDLGVVQLGADASTGEPSWSERMLVLRDDPDLGPLRLGYLEAIVRLADWRASEAADRRDGR